MKVYYVETNAYDMIVADLGDYRRVHIVEDKPKIISEELFSIAENPYNLSGDDYYDKTAEELIGDANVTFSVEKDEGKKYLSDYPMPCHYEFDDLRKAALRPDATVGDRMMLLKYMWNYALNSSWDAWNGEYYDIGDGKKLIPIDEPIAFDDGEPFQWEAYDAQIA